MWIEHDIMTYSRASNKKLDALYKQYKPDILPVMELMQVGSLFSFSQSVLEKNWSDPQQR